MIPEDALGVSSAGDAGGGLRDQQRPQRRLDRGGAARGGCGAGGVGTRQAARPAVHQGPGRLRRRVKDLFSRDVAQRGGLEGGEAEPGCAHKAAQPGHG